MALMMILIMWLGAVTMDADFGAQLDKEHQGELVQLYRQLTAGYTGGGSIHWVWLYPRLALHRWKLARRIDVLLKDHIQRKFAERQQSGFTGGKKDRSVLALSLQQTEHLDSSILEQTADQLKSFLFAGHDTTSIVLQWAFYELSRTPRALSAIRHELDELFGPGSSPETVRDMLCSPQSEDLVSRMHYVSVVVKEILRLYPPSGTARYMSPGSGYNVQLPGDDGQTLCLDGMVVYNCETLVHRDETVYGETTHDFMPERWLNTDTSQAPPNSAWRPFERGPRNCIGQELAILEARVILACAVRRYDFVKVGLGAVARNDRGEPTVDAQGRYEVESPLYNVSGNYFLAICLLF